MTPSSCTGCTSERGSRPWTRPHRGRARATAGAVLLGLLQLVSPSRSAGQPSSRPPPVAPPQDLIAKGRQLFDDQRYEDSIQALSAALLRPNNTSEQKVEIHRLLALDYITLGRRDEADAAVRALLAAQPDYQLPATESPRFRDFFAEARARWEAEGRPGLTKEAPPLESVVLRHASPPSADRGKAIELRARLADPDRRTASVKLYYRSGSRSAFAVTTAEIDGASVRAQIPAASVKPPTVEYYFDVVDGRGAVIAARGDAQAPLRVAVPDGGPGWVVPLAIGGGLLGAAAIVGGLALAGVFEGAAPAAGRRATVTVTVGETGLRW